MMLQKYKKNLPTLTIGIVLVISSLYPMAHAVTSAQQAPISACSDKEDGDACDFVNEKGEDVNGNCHQRGPNGALVCVQYIAQ